MHIMLYLIIFTNIATYVVKLKTSILKLVQYIISFISYKGLILKKHLILFYWIKMT